VVVRRLDRFRQATPEGWTRCKDCSGLVPEPLKRCRRRRCPGYSPIWAGDVRRKVFSALDAYASMVPSGVKAPRVKLLTLTAPGKDRLPWDESHCRELGPHDHSGLLGCRVQSGALAGWNRTAPDRWRDLNRAAYQATVREVGSGAWLLVRPWELQKRGALHAHPLLAYSTLGEKRAADAYLRHLDRLAEHYGFGYVDRKHQVREPRAAAAYLSSYFVSGKKGKLSLRESVVSRQMPRSIFYVSPNLSQRSGVTMRSLRLVRFRWYLMDRWDRYVEVLGEPEAEVVQLLEQVEKELAIRGP
jgi:hypothetical protein